MGNSIFFGQTAIVAAILCIPATAMLFTDEVNWGLLDFGVAALLLVCLGAVVNYVAKRIETGPKRIATVSIVVLSFVLVWAELAVGIFGTPFAGS